VLIIIGDCLAISDTGVLVKVLRRGFIIGKSGAGFGVEGVTCRAGHGVLAYCWLGEGGGMHGCLAVWLMDWRYWWKCRLQRD
jgi:hypothetical protein